MANEKQREDQKKGQQVKIGKMSELIESAISDDSDLKKLAEKAARIKTDRKKKG